ncbi:MAG: hypothetical protein GX660_04320 [Clostridiaceae bacterium]|nr:hypothetical protein [Clostridiaceae bacterium]
MDNYITIISNTGEELADLLIDDRSIEVSRKINGEFCLDFECPHQELKTEYIDTNNSVVVDGQSYDILYFKEEHEDNKINYKVQCNHVFYRLVQKTYPYYTFDGTPSEILADILSDTNFSVGQVDKSDIITFAVAEEMTAAQLILTLCESQQLEIDFSVNGFTINLYNLIGQDHGFEIRYGKNLKGIRRIHDKREGELKISYEVDILELKNSTEYIEKGYQSLEVIELGDTVYIIDEKTGLNVENRIVSMIYNPLFRKNTKVEIANKIELFTDKITKIERETVAKNKLYNGIRISPDNGFEAIRSDELVKSTMNATKGFEIAIKNELGEYIPAFYAQINNGKARLFLTGNAVIAGHITGGTIDLGDGTFTVDEEGNMTAKSGTYEGDINIESLDKLSKSVIKSNEMAFQSGDGLGNYKNRLYYGYDTEKDETTLIFDGKLSASVIEAIQADIDIIVNNTFITQNLYAEYGRIANLSVSELNTSWKKIVNYLNADKSDVNYVRIYEKYMKWITATTDGNTTEQLTDTDNNLLYWIDETHTGMTKEVTAYQVLTYEYIETTKFEVTFEDSGNKAVKMVLGTGFGYADPNEGKAFIMKDSNGLLLKYVQSGGNVLQLRLGDNGIEQIGNTGVAGLRNIYVSPDGLPPANPQLNDLCIVEE